MTFLRAVATMVGSIVGVGVFGLPYVFAQAGYAVGLLTLLVVTAVMASMLLMYADVVAHTQGNHRFAGVIEAYLGTTWARVGTVTLAFGFWGAMLAYVVGGGAMLSVLFGVESAAGETALGLCVVASVAALSYRGLSFVARLEVWVLGLLAFLFLFMVLAALPHADLARLAVAHGTGGWIPAYGVIFFALTGGLSAIPEMRALLGKRSSSLSSAVVLGLGAVALLYAVFTFAVVAATGGRTTEFAVDGLAALLGDTFRVVGVALAFGSVLSIFSVAAMEMQNTLRYDNSMSARGAWALTLAAPVLLYLAGIRSFVGVMGFIGAVFAGVNGMLVVLAYERMRSSKVCREHVCLEIPRWATAGITLFYLAGIAVTLFSYA